MIKSKFPILIAFLMMALMYGCSGGGGDPVTPSDTERPVAEQVSKTSCLGLWQVVVDTEAGTIETVDMRNSDLILNVLGFLEPPALGGMTINFTTLKINESNKTIEVDVILVHPILDATFTGFDVRGVVFGPEITNADGLTVIPSPEFFAGVPFGYQDGLLGVPDGTADYEGLAGYKYFADGLGLNVNLVTFFSNTTNLNNRGKFGATSIPHSRHYVLDWTNSDEDFFVFNYAIYANYDWPVGAPPITVDDFDIATANSAEAFCGKITEVSNTLWYSGGSGGGDFSLDAEIWDWQGDIQEVVFYSDDLGVPETAAVDAGPGTTSKSELYTIDFIGASPSASGEAWVYVKAIDPVTFGDAWFMGLLPSSNPMHGENVYSVYVIPIDVSDCPAPTVTAIDPDSAPPGTDLTDVEVSGSDFVDGGSLAVTLKMTGADDINATNVAFDSDTLIICDISIPGDQDTGDYDVVVTNGCGTDGIGVELFNIFFVPFEEDFDTDPANWAYDCTQWESCGPQEDPLWTTSGPNGPSGAGNIRSQKSGVSPDGGFLSTVVTIPFAVPSGYSEVNVRVYQCAGFGGGWVYFFNCNWKIAESSTPGMSPFDPNNANVPSGGAILQNSTSHGSGWPTTGNDCGYGPMSDQAGWNSTENYGGGAFPGSLSAYLDLIIPASYYGKTVKICWQFQTDECGYGWSSGYAFDDMELKFY